MYGATSFVGVINVIHYPAGESAGRLMLSGGGTTGNLGNLSAAASTALPDVGPWSQSISADLERQRYADEKAGFERGHALYRAATDALDGTFRLDLDLNVLRQSPLSPYPRVGNGLDPAIDTDANFHPADAAIDETRAHLTTGYTRSTAIGEWETTLALSHTSGDIVRGFLSDSCGPEAPDPATNACGHKQDRRVTDIYFDTHLITQLSDQLTTVIGIDDLFGKGTQEATIFDYSVDPVHGNDAPASSSRPAIENSELDVERNFAGAYGQIDWTPTDPIHVIAGLRLNSTHEVREGEEDLESGPVPSRQSRSDTQLSGSIGLTWQAWASQSDAVTLFADYRDTFKPAAVDFGPEAESDILDPETAHVAELGVKSRWLGGRLDLDITGYDMTMKNLVVPQNINGSPGLANAGILHLKGAEAEINWHLAEYTQLRVGYAHHTSRFGDYLRLFDGEPTQLAGNSQELSPRDTGSIGVLFAAPEGLILSADYTYTGERYLNKRNTSLAPSFGLLDASVGYRFQSWELRLDGRNLTDARGPVSESELGDGQYYRMPARTISLAVVAYL
jgi:outer membrane receptor for ferric coprogen and ferric-rhodotorulic acid